MPTLGNHPRVAWSPPSLTPLVLAGFFIPKSNIPPYWIWFHYISHFKYAEYGLVSNYFSNMPNTRYGCPPPNEGNPNCSLSGKSGRPERPK